MTNRIIKGLLYSTLFIGVGCSKQLDTLPTTSVDASVALRTSNDVKALLVGAYSDFGNDDFFGGRVFMEGDMLASTNDISWTGTYQGMTQMVNKAIVKENPFVAETWLSGYRAINDVNNVLAAITVVNKSDSARVAGEAKFIRGASYFQLVKMYAKAWNDGNPTTNLGVPIVLTPTTIITENSKVTRNTVAEVYAQVIKDLTEAEAELPAENGFFANTGAAAAMLARVYLQQGDYAKALQAANRAITNGRSAEGARLALAGSYSGAFVVGNTVEDIFATQVTSTSGIQGFNEFYSSSQRGDIQVTTSHLQLYEADDSRRKLFYTDNGSVYVGKYEELYGNVHIMRLAEMMLVRAECNFRLNTAVGAAPIDDINAIRARANASLYAADQLTLDRILFERRLELAFEGFGLDDVKRLQTNVGNLPWNSPRLIFPIPYREVVANPNLAQNEGY